MLAASLRIITLKSRAYSYLRLSRDTQLKGDGHRRQLEASRDYAAANELELVDGGELEDIGVSAYRGTNIREGALGRFLEAVRSRAVKPGSFLIVESLDRLSREKPREALSLFLSIINAGINLVTLTDKRVYRADNVDLSDLLVSLMIMSRAHEESETKSRRVREAWEKKRANAASVPMGKICPAWLEFRDNPKRYVEIPERVAIVKRIFSEAANGIGMFSIPNRFNEEGLPTFGGSNGWHQSYVGKILSNRAVLGEYQPHIKRDGKRTAVGDPIPGYFPAIIDQQQFYQVQIAKSERKVSGAGRKGRAYSNLFSGLAKCAYCGASMKFENKGAGRENNSYLICDHAMRRLGCTSLRWRYNDFEASFIALVNEIDFAEILDGPGKAGAQETIQTDIDALRGRLAEKGSAMEKVYQLLTDDGPIDFIRSKLAELQREKSSIESQLKARTNDLQELYSRRADYNRSAREIGTLIDRLQGPPDGKLFELRALLASRFKSIVESLKVASLGYVGSQQVKLPPSSRADSIMQRFEWVGRKLTKPGQRYFQVFLRDGRARVVYPKDEDPRANEITSFLKFISE
jgi:DNA invertase Pin-like site-specific DNA recombinase